MNIPLTSPCRSKVGSNKQNKKLIEYYFSLCLIIFLLIKQINT